MRKAPAGVTYDVRRLLVGFEENLMVSPPSLRRPTTCPGLGGVAWLVDRRIVIVRTCVLKHIIHQKDVGCKQMVPEVVRDTPL